MRKSTEKIYAENKEEIMKLKEKIGNPNYIKLVFDEHKSIIKEKNYGDNPTLKSSFKETIKRIKSIIDSKEVVSILDLIEKKRYTKTIASYSDTIRENVIPIKIEYPNNDVSSTRWCGYFINLDNGNIYFISAGFLKHSKYRYEFHTIYLDDSIERHKKHTVYILQYIIKNTTILFIICIGIYQIFGICQIYPLV